MGKRWACTAVLWIVCAVAAAGLWLYFVEINLGDLFGRVTAGSRSVLTEVSAYLGCADGTIGIKGLRLIRLLFERKGHGAWLSGTAALIRVLKLLITVPYLCILGTGVCAAFRRLWSYIAACALSALGLVFLLSATLLVLPSSLHTQIKEQVEGVAEAGTGILDAADALTGLDGVGVAVQNLIDTAQGAAEDVRNVLEEYISPKAFRTLIFQGLGPGWWICVVCLGLLAVFGAVGIFLALRNEEMGAAKNIHGSIRVLAGELAGAVVAIPAVGYLLIGSDPGRCQLVVHGAGIAPVHCAIGRSDQKQMYQVRNLSMAGMLCGTQMLESGGTRRFPSGSEITIGRGVCMLRLL